jgi:ADP-ribose pyrophosphatase YjhB (NUDIX family)
MTKRLIPLECKNISDSSTHWPMKFCTECSAPLQVRIPEGDNQPRHCCPSCNTIHYINPKMVVGTIPTFENKILLCKRAIEPRYGFWTLPAGFLELGETTLEGALRETWEEAGARVNLGPLFSMFDVLHAEQVHLFFRATMTSTEFKAGTESLDVQLFAEEDIPWDELAFNTVSKTLKLFLQDRKQGTYSLHTGNVLAPQTRSSEQIID